MVERKAKRDEATQASEKPEVVPSEHAVPMPAEAVEMQQAAESAGLAGAGGPVQPTPPTPPAPNAPVRARFKGRPGENITPLLVAERNPDGSITERIYITPGRNLTDDEFEAMPAVQRAYVQGSPHYDVASHRQAQHEARDARDKAE